VYHPLILTVDQGDNDRNREERMKTISYGAILVFLLAACALAGRAIAQTPPEFGPAPAAAADSDEAPAGKSAKAKHKKHMTAKKAKKPADDDATPAAPAVAPKS
jgi:hypothetical protein